MADIYGSGRSPSDTIEMSSPDSTTASIMQTTKRANRRIFKRSRRPIYMPNYGRKLDLEELFREVSAQVESMLQRNRALQVPLENLAARTRDLQEAEIPTNELIEALSIATHDVLMEMKDNQIDENLRKNLLAAARLDDQKLSQMAVELMKRYDVAVVEQMDMNKVIEEALSATTFALNTLQAAARIEEMVEAFIADSTVQFLVRTFSALGFGWVDRFLRE